MSNEHPPRPKSADELNPLLERAKKSREAAELMTAQSRQGRSMDLSTTNQAALRRHREKGISEPAVVDTEETPLEARVIYKQAPEAVVRHDDTAIYNAAALHVAATDAERVEYARSGATHSGDRPQQTELPVSSQENDSTDVSNEEDDDEITNILFGPKDRAASHSAMSPIDGLHVAAKANDIVSFSEAAPKTDVFSVDEWRSMLEELLQDPKVAQTVEEIADSAEKNQKKREAGFDQVPEGFGELPAAPALLNIDSSGNPSWVDDDEPTDRYDRSGEHSLYGSNRGVEHAETSGPKERRNLQKDLNAAQADVVAQVTARIAAKKAPALSAEKPPLRMPEQPKKQTSWFGRTLRRFGMIFGLAAAFQGDQDQSRVEAAVQQQAVEDTSSAQIVQPEAVVSVAPSVEIAPVSQEAVIAETPAPEAQVAMQPDVSKIWIQQGEGVSQAMLGLGYDISNIQEALRLSVTVGDETKTLADVFVDAKGGELGMVIAENADGKIDTVQFYTGDPTHILSPTELTSVMHFVSPETPAVKTNVESKAPQAAMQSDNSTIDSTPPTALQDVLQVATENTITPDVPPIPTMTELPPKNPDTQNPEQLVAKKPEDEDVVNDQVETESPRMKVEAPDRYSPTDPARQLSGLEDILDQMDPGTEVYYSPLVFRIPEEGGEVQIRHITDAQHYYKLTPLLLQTLGFDYRKDYENKRLTRGSFRDIVAGQGLEPIPR